MGQEGPACVRSTDSDDGSFATAALEPESGLYATTTYFKGLSDATLDGIAAPGSEAAPTTRAA